jgi:HlyD family secretion protein
MRIKRGIIIAVCSGIVVVASYFVFGSSSKSRSQYTFVSLTKGNIESTIASSGTLNPVTEVTVGTQVSGTIEKVYADFNDEVKKGQIIAVLDSSVLRMAVEEAQAGMIKAEAQLDETQANYVRSDTLFKRGLLSPSDFQSVKTSLKNAQAGMILANAARDRSIRNLSYAIIRSPIDGTVTARSVEVGQTVAASFSTPTLFTIAQDLSKMEIKASVDEGDIGQIKEGQVVRFTVQAYAEKNFEGRVRQVRVQPTTTSNVVNYAVIISADNRDGLLLPGMTATVDFIIEQRTNVLLVHNAALRFQPLADEASEAINLMMKTMGPPPSNSERAPILRDGQLAQVPFNMELPKASDNMKQLWFVDSSGTLRMDPVRIGISDGTNTEILWTRLTSGARVISAAGTKLQKMNSTRGRPSAGGPPPPMM